MRLLQFLASLARKPCIPFHILASLWSLSRGLITVAGELWFEMHGVMEFSGVSGQV